jgi:hypothetical protein
MDEAEWYLFCAQARQKLANQEVAYARYNIKRQKEASMVTERDNKRVKRVPFTDRPQHITESILGGTGGQGGTGGSGGRQSDMNLTCCCQI